ncbi:MAG TPA: sigma-70 family RNA polymerase sigma factor [Thermoanaerobaculia bacterium]|nr:sigma-70 family RNA polymerase sigma factor [Thermoanaerobaculia bacterium]
MFQLSQVRERMAFPVPFYPVSSQLERTPAGERLRADALAVNSGAELDGQLLDGVAAGDADALAMIFDRHGAAVLGVLTRMLGRAGEADEVLQEVFLWLWKHPRRYDPSRSSLRGWLLVIARSRALDVLRADRSRRVREEGVERDRPTVHEPVPLADLERREAERRLQAAMVTLPDEQRRCIELAFFAGLSHSQIAARLQQPLGTVKSRIQLGMAKLRAALTCFAPATGAA